MILSDKDLQLLNSMATTSEADSSNSKDNDLKIEFDGTTVLCRVCGDKASGFHYGVHSCEGCKGFFRRSIQQKIQYRPCTKNQQCSILRINRNRCQYCRLKKCIAVGMSRDAVRFGRVPKREKAKILAAMQKVNQNSQEKHLNEQLEDEQRLLASILQAHQETCDYTKDKVAPLIERARTQPIYAHCPPQMACPLNPMPAYVADGAGANRILEDFSERFSPAIRGVVEFAKRIPGFGMLSQDDQVTLLKAGVFEVLLVRLACMFDSQTNSMICLNGLVLRRESLHSASNARFLLDSMFDFAERLNQMNLTDNEIGLFCGVVVIAPDRPGLRNVDLVQKIHRKLDNLLHTSVTGNHSDNSGIFSELKKKIPDLRTLNTLHSEKLLAYKMEPKNGSPFIDDDLNANNNNNLSNGDDIDSSKQENDGNYITTQLPSPIHSSSTSPPAHAWHHSYGNSNNHLTRPMNVHSPHACNSSDWSDSKDGHENLYGSPRSVGSSILSTDESLHNPKSPLRRASISSAKSGTGGYEMGCYSPSEQMAQFHIGKPKPGSIKTIGASMSASTTTPTPVGRFELVNNESLLTTGESDYYNNEVKPNAVHHAHHHHTMVANNGNGFNKHRRVDSPTDSGIESGKEACNASTPTTSVCSSPRSAMDDKVKDVSDSESSSEKQESIDDMPMLKRALQAPPLINTNMLMDEAYRHHKKFRASKRDGEPQSPSTTTMMTTTMTNNNGSGMGVISSANSVTDSSSNHVQSSFNDSLASSHSTLVKTLEQAPRYMNEQQLKRTDLIHNIIMRNEAVPASSSSITTSSNTSVAAGNIVYHSSSNIVQAPQTHMMNAKGVVVYPQGYYIPSASQPPAGVCPYSNARRSPTITTTMMNGGAMPTMNMNTINNNNVPRIMYATSEAQIIQQQQRRSPFTAITGSTANLVIGSNSSSPPLPLSKLGARLLNGTSSATTAPAATVAILMSSNGSNDNSIDSQPLNLSKKPSPPNSPPTVVKIES